MKHQKCTTTPSTKGRFGMLKLSMLGMASAFAFLSVYAEEYDPTKDYAGDILTPLTFGADGTKSGTLTGRCYRSSLISMNGGGSIHLMNNSTLTIPSSRGLANTLFVSTGNGMGAASFIIDEGSIFNAASSATYTSQAITLKGISKDGDGNVNKGSLIVNGTATFALSDSQAGIRIEGNGVIDVGKNGRMTINKGITSVYNATGVGAEINVDGYMSTGGQISLAQSSQMTVSGTYDLTTSGLGVQMGGGALILSGADCGFTVKDGGKAYIETDSKYVYCIWSGTTMLVDNGGLLDITATGAAAGVAGSAIYGTLNINGEMKYTANADCYGLQLATGTVNVASTGSYTSNTSVRLAEVGSNLNVSGSLKSNKIYFENGGSVTVAAGSTVKTDYIIFGNKTNPATLNLYATAKMAESNASTMYRFQSANAVNINVGDGVAMGTFHFDAAPDSLDNGLITINLVSDADKSGIVTIDRLYATSSGTKASILIEDFANNYIRIIDTGDIDEIGNWLKIISDIDGTKYTRLITLTGKTEGGDSFTDGWYLEAIDGTTYYYLNNSHIPEPASVAALFGLVALFAAARMRRK